MSFGFLGINESSVLIDDNFSNYQVIAEGTMVSQTEEGFLASLTWTPTIPDSWVLGENLLFVRPPNNTVEFVLASSAGRYAQTGFFIYATEAVTFQYKLVAPASTIAPATGWGLSIFKPEGAVAFSLDHRAAKIVASISLNIRGTPSSVTVSLPATLKEKYVNISGTGAMSQLVSYFSDISYTFLSETTIRIYRSFGNSNLHYFSTLIGYF